MKSEQDPSEKLDVADIVEKLSGGVKRNPVIGEENSGPNISSPLRLLQTSLTDSFKEVSDQSKSLLSSVEKQKEKDAKIPKEEIMARIMQSMGDSLRGVGDSISSDELHEIGLMLIRCYSSVELAATKLKMTPARLRYLIINVPELHVYLEIAHEGVKGLTDQRIIEGLMAGDSDIVKMVFNKMYAGRHKGGYNIAEIGTIGYKDPLAKELAAETESDRTKMRTVVEFNLVTKDKKEKFEPIAYVDAEVIEEESGQ